MIARLATGTLALAISLALSGCGAGYLLQAARGQAQLMSARQPIDRVIEDPATSIDVRDRLTSAAEIRTFASRELGLPDNDSYRSYARIDRPYVVWNVVATPEFSVEPRQWCFPIVGCVAYRGYFKERSAKNYALTLASQGYDVTVGGVPAYSTLGRFADPLISTMMGYGEHELASLIFHELSHQLVYVPGDSAFNEAFAVTVEQAGLARWLQAHGRPEEIVRYRERRARQAEVATLFSKRRGELRRLYTQQIAPQLMRDRKRAIFTALAQDLTAFETKHRIRSGYRDWVERGLNNAHLASVATYYGCVPGFERLLDQEGGDLPRFYDAVRELAKRPYAERRAVLCAPS